MSSLPKGWVETELSSVVSHLGDGLHGTPKYSDDGEYYFINGNNLREGKIVFTKDTKRASIDEFNKHKKNLNNRTLFVSINGTLGNIAEYNNERCFLGKSACYFNILDDVDKKFIKYVLTNHHFQKYIDRLAGGTTIKNVSLKTMREYPINLPPLPGQKSIANILSSFDEKIELLREQNETLETLAQTIFKEWFVDFNYPNATGEMVGSEFGEIPKGWRVGSLLDVFELVGGGTPKTTNKEYWSGNIPWYSVVDVPKGSNSFVIDTEKHISEIGLNNSSTKLLRKGTTIVSARGSVGKLAIVGQEMAMNQSCYGLNGKNDCGDYYVFFQVKEILNTLKNNVHGAVFDTITTSTFASIKVPIPTPLLFNNFEISIMPIMEKILNNVYQIQTLTKTRDILLPKLMSGEIRVSI